MDLGSTVFENRKLFDQSVRDYERSVDSPQSSLVSDIVNRLGVIRFRRSRVQSPDKTKTSRSSNEKTAAAQLQTHTHSESVEPSTDERFQTNRLSERERDILELIRTPAEQYVDRSMSIDDVDSFGEENPEQVDSTLEKILSLPVEAFHVPDSIKQRLRSVAQQFLKEEVRLRSRNNAPGTPRAHNTPTALVTNSKKHDSPSASSESSVPCDASGQPSSPSENRAPTSTTTISLRGRPRSVAPSISQKQTDPDNVVPSSSVSISNSASDPPPSPRRLRTRSMPKGMFSPASRSPSPTRRRFSPVKRSIKFLQNRLRPRSRYSMLLPPASSRPCSSSLALPLPDPEQVVTRSAARRRSLRLKTPSTKTCTLFSDSPTPLEDK